MAHSLELLLDPVADAAIREAWEALAEAGLPSQAKHRSPTNRPHVTVAVAEVITPGVDAMLVADAALAGLLPLSGRIGALMMFGTRRPTLVRLVVPSVGLLELHERVGYTAAEYLRPGPMTGTTPGRWTPHVTLCRGLRPADLPAALEALSATGGGGRQFDVAFTGLRRWDSDARTDRLVLGSG